MSLFSIVVPAEAENLVENPSLEIEGLTTGYAGYAGGAGLITIDDYARFGRKSLEVTPNSGTGDGVSIGDTGSNLIPASASTPYNVTFWLYNPNLVPLLFEAFDQDDNSLNTPVSWDGLGEIWEEIELQITTGSGDTGLYVAIYKDGDATTQKYYLDGCQVVPSANKHTYIDGDQENCFWTGARHASTSKRTASGPGGIEYDFEDLGINVENWAGFGMPSVINHTQGLGVLPGGFFENSKVRDRLMTLSLFANGTSLENLQTLKQQFIDAVKKDRGAFETQFRIIYKGHVNAERRVYTNVYYDAGLEGSQVRGFFEHFAVRFLGVDPWWYEEHQQIDELTLRKITEDFPRIIMRREGVWAWTGSAGCSVAGVRGFAEDPVDGSVIIVGEFFSIDGVSSTLYFCRYADGIESVVGQLPDDIVRAAAIAPNRDIYIAGEFVQIGITNRYYVAMYDYSGSSWSSLGSGPGLNNDAYAIAIDLEGNVYVGGLFTDEQGGGGGTYNRIIKWTGSAWAALSTGLDAECRAIAVHPTTGDVYIGGDFTTAGGSTFNRIVKWDGSAFSKVDWGGGFDGDVTGLVFAPDGTLYAIGAFTTASGNTVNKVAGWRGGNWFALGSGVTGGTPTGIGMVGDQLWIAGMTEVDGIAVPRLAFWNGSTWVHPDFGDGGAQATTAVFGDSQGNIFFGGDVDDSSTEVAVSTTVNNPGTAEVRPIFDIIGDGRLVWIGNYTTGDEMYFDLDILEDEEITIDCRVGNRGIRSNWRKSVQLLPREGSDFGNFRLIPGDNEIVVLMRDAGSGAKGYVRIEPIHWSVEGGADD